MGVRDAGAMPDVREGKNQQDQGGIEMSMLKQLWNDEEAANAVEYGLIAAVIAVALIGVFTLFRQEIVGLFTRQAGEIGNQ